MARRKRKGLVEEAWRLRVGDFLTRYRGQVRDGPVWLDARRPDGVGELLPLRFDVLGSGESVQLAYEHRGTAFTYRLDVATLPQHLGGVRFWRCPLVGVNGRGCERRVRALYLPAGARYFGCACCHDLTYASVQRPVVSRVGRLLKTLDLCYADLASADRSRAVGGVIFAREAVKGFLASLQRA
jgi:hypothetical protein